MGINMLEIGEKPGKKIFSKVKSGTFAERPCIN